jgi:hypothetical protein
MNKLNFDNINVARTLKSLEQMPLEPMLFRTMWLDQKLSLERMRLEQKLL